MSKDTEVMLLVVGLPATLALGVVIGMGLVLDQAPKSAAPGLEQELKRCVVVLQETQKATDFWREQALAMRTDGVDSVKKHPE